MRPLRHRPALRNPHPPWEACVRPSGVALRTTTWPAAPRLTYVHPEEQKAGSAGVCGRCSRWGWPRGDHDADTHARGGLRLESRHTACAGAWASRANALRGTDRARGAAAAWYLEAERRPPRAGWRATALPFTGPGISTRGDREWRWRLDDAKVLRAAKQAPAAQKWLKWVEFRVTCLSPQ